MKKVIITLLLEAGLLLMPISNNVMAQGGDKKPPVAKKERKVTDINGYKLIDDYFWMRDKKNPEVVGYLNSENAYTEEMMKPTKELQNMLYKEMLGRIKQTDLSVPYRIGEYYYYSALKRANSTSICAAKKAACKARKNFFLT